MTVFAAYYPIDLSEPRIYLGLGVIVVVVSIALAFVVGHVIPWFQRRDDQM